MSGKSVNIKNSTKAPRIFGGLFFALVFSLSASLLFAQQKGQPEPPGKKIEIINSDRVSFDSRINADAQMLVGNVQLEHKGVIMYCDSALLFQGTNRLEAYGDVEINQGDTLHLYGDSLFYNGNIRQGKVIGNVMLEEKETELTTDVLLYNAVKSEAYYTTGGRIVSKKNQNVLTSTRGTYASKVKTFYFKDQVKLVNPDYTMNTDTMDYNSRTETAFFFGPTVIRSEENLLYAENGWYNTKTDRASFREKAFMISNEQKLEGDSLYYDRVKGTGEVFRNITITDTVNDFLIYGDYGIHFEKEKNSMITKQPRAIKLFEDDSLFMKADTIYAMEDSLGVKTVLGYRNVSYFKTDLQGVCDTIVYAGADSSITMFGKPVIWNEENQISGHNIVIYSDGKNPRELFIDKDSYITQLVDTIYNQYNQVKGRELHGYFQDDELKKIFISGNGETIFYIQEEKPDSTKELIGINKAECSDITILLDSGEIKTITFAVAPVATAMAVDKLGSADLLLKNFKWDGDRRPANKEQVMKKEEVIEIEPAPVKNPKKEKKAKKTKKKK